MRTDKDYSWLSKDIFLPIAKRIKSRADSLCGMKRFPRTGIEAWLKVEAIAALGTYVERLQNKGPDMYLSNGRQIELKGATDLNAVDIAKGATKYRTPCLFLGDGNSPNLAKLQRRNDVELLAHEIFSDGHTDWVLGLLVPKELMYREGFRSLGSLADGSAIERAVTFHAASGGDSGQAKTSTPRNQNIRADSYIDPGSNVCLRSNSLEDLRAMILGRDGNSMAATIDAKLVLGATVEEMWRAVQPMRERMGRDFATTTEIRRHLRSRERDWGWVLEKDEAGVIKLVGCSR